LTFSESKSVRAGRREPARTFELDQFAINWHRKFDDKKIVVAKPHLPEVHKVFFISSTMFSLFMQVSCTRDEVIAAIATLAIDLQATIVPIGATIQANGLDLETRTPVAGVDIDDTESNQPDPIAMVITPQITDEPAPSATALPITNTPPPPPTETSTSTPEPPPSPTAVPTATTMPLEFPVAGGAMYFIPGGFFEMGAEASGLFEECTNFTDGCQEEWFAPSEPAHMVLLAPYFLDLHEVTNEAYVTFLNDIFTTEVSCLGQPCVVHDESQVSREENTFFVAAEFSNYPVAGVTWYGAAAYCEWRSARLPTEAEWEKAAGWDDQAATKRRYPWGEVFDGELVNFCDVNCEAPQSNSDFDDGQAAAGPIMSYERGRSPSGGYDLGGNVWEWVSDWFDAEFFTEAIYTNPIGPETGEAKVVRGGSWFDTGNFMATTIRFPSPPDNADKTIGFRCAADLPRP
jgi:formylglycine-generating enzyme required for sulfatase activity